MPDLSIKNVPKHELESIRAEARRNHRSLQGQLRVIIAEAAARHAGRPLQRKRTAAEVITQLRHIALKTPSESVRMIREDRDGR